MNGRLAITSLILIVLTATAYHNTADCDFVNYDDHTYVTGNPYITQGLTLEGISDAFNIGYAANWHPLTWISHMLDVELYGLDPMGHHITSLVFHILNTLLLFYLLYRMTGYTGRSAFIAALFAVHPLHVESVAWVSERKDVLSTFFLMLSLLTYHRYTQSPSIKRYLPVLILFVLGLMSKPMLVTMPFILLLLDFWPLKRVEKMGWGRLILEKIPFFALSLASCAITIVAQQKGEAVSSLAAYPADVRTANAAVAYVQYIIKMFLPQDLAVFYPHPENTLPAWQVAGSLVFLVLVSCVVISKRSKSPYLLWGWLWYVVTLVPVIGLMQVGVQSYADRYTYVPLTGLFVSVTWGLAEVFIKSNGYSIRRAAAVVLPVSVVMLLAVMTSRQTEHWRNSLALWTHTLDVTTKNAVAHYNLGRALEDISDMGSAEREYISAIQIDPAYADAHNNLGIILAGRGRTQQAYQHYRKSLQIDPANANAHNNLGALLAGQRKYAEAAREFITAVKLKPDYAEAHYNLAGTYCILGRYKDSWKEVSLCRKYGFEPDQAFIAFLSSKMPEPTAR